MINQFDFAILSPERISKEFVSRNILSFSDAAEFIKDLPYGRNADKTDLPSLFDDNCGTCSTKHALLRQLADENNYRELRLILGLFKMNGINTPEVSDTLRINGLEYIPEAHCYLKFKDSIIDCTKKNSDPTNFVGDLIEEKEISPGQITGYKVSYHKQYLESWLGSNPQLNMTFADLWTIREQCIRDLTTNTNK